MSFRSRASHPSQSVAGGPRSVARWSGTHGRQGRLRPYRHQISRLPAVSCRPIGMTPERHQGCGVASLEAAAALYGCASADEALRLVRRAEQIIGRRDPEGYCKADPVVRGERASRGTVGANSSRRARSRMTLATQPACFSRYIRHEYPASQLELPTLTVTQPGPHQLRRLANRPLVSPTSAVNSSPCSASSSAGYSKAHEPESPVGHQLETSYE